jgi:23S rRNA pseudouridine1911/1915/1917 synthase
MSQNNRTPVSAHGFEYGVKHFANKSAGELMDIVANTLQMPPTEVQALLNLGAIYVNNQRQNTNTSVANDQLFRVHTKPRRFNCDFDWRARVVFENADFVVLNKPSGIPSHPSVDNIVENALTQLSMILKVPLFITHRLDTLTEGLIVYAKTQQFVRAFNIQLQDQLTEKKYVALVEAEHELPARLIHYMEPSPRAPKTVSPNAIEGWAFCELEILSQKKTIDGLWIKINLLTGRTHQIRSQLSEVGAPILGDSLYGSKNSWKNGGIALRACELQFNWAGQRLQFKLDEDFINL